MHAPHTRLPGQPRRYRRGWPVLCLLVLLFPFFAQAQSAGRQSVPVRIISIVGHVTLEDSKGQRRSVHHGQLVKLGEKLETGVGSRVQLRLHRDGMITLEENSSFTLVAYDQQGEEDAREELRFSFARGAFRAIGDNHGFVMETPMATVTSSPSGNGNTYDCALRESLDCGVYDGSITLSNQRGIIWLGGASDYAYASVADAGSLPAGSQQKPDALTNPNAPPPRSRLQPLPQEERDSGPEQLPESPPIRITPARR